MEDETLEQLLARAKPQLDQLKDEFGDAVHNDELILLRFLVGHKFNMDEVRKRLEGYAEWAEKIGLDSITKELVIPEEVKEGQEEEEEAKHKPLSQRVIDEEQLELHHRIIRWFPKRTFYSHAKNGNLVTFIHWGGIVPTFLMNCVTLDEFTLYQAQTQAIARITLNALSQENNRLMRGYVVLDMGGVGVQHLSIDFLRWLGPMFEVSAKYFPEMVEKFVIINTMAGFESGWKIVASFLEEEVRKKCIIVGTNFLEALSQDIDQELIPQELGGYCGRKYIPCFEKQHQTVDIPAGKKRSEEIEVDGKVSEVIQWDWRTEYRDLGFEVSFNDEIVVPYKRVDCDKQVQTGQFQTKGISGKMKFLFDNSYSYWYSKKLIYSIQQK